MGLFPLFLINQQITLPIKPPIHQISPQTILFQNPGVIHHPAQADRVRPAQADHSHPIPTDRHLIKIAPEAENR